MSLLIFDGARAEEVRALVALGQMMAAEGLGDLAIVGATEIVGVVTLNDGAQIQPAGRLRNRPPQELVMLPGYTEDREVRSLLQARAPMDESVLALGGGIRLMAEAGLLEGRRITCPKEDSAKVSQSGAEVTPAPFTAEDDLSTVASAEHLEQWLKTWLASR